MRHSDLSTLRPLGLSPFLLIPLIARGCLWRHRHLHSAEAGIGD